MGRIVGGCCALFRGEAGYPRNTMWLAYTTGILIDPAVWPQQTYAENWGLCSFFFGGRAGSPYNTMSPGPT